MTNERTQARSRKKNSPPWKNINKSYKPFLHSNIMGRTEDLISSTPSYLINAEDEAIAIDNSSGSEAGKESSPLESPLCSPPGSPLTPHRAARRRRKQRSPKESRQIEIENVQNTPENPNVNRFKNLNLSENQLVELLLKYKLTHDQMASLGYPIESAKHPLRALIYTMDFSANRRSFESNYQNPVAEKQWLREEDSGQGSGSSSPRSPDTDPDSEEEKTSNERRCTRCSRGFFVSKTGNYLTKERCRHHHGRLHRKMDDNSYIPVWNWSCCGSSAKSLGCIRTNCHVWSGTQVGLNGPFDGYVRTKPRTAWKPGMQILALDCEMCYSALGLQIARVEAMNIKGEVVYSSYVIPEHPIIDYNTRFSGITEEDIVLNATKTISEVQADLLEFIDADTVLIGHGLENDLRALKILHDSVVDTAVCFPHERGLPYRQSLKSLAMQYLNLEIQHGEHCPVEDARVSMDLVLWRVQHDHRLLSVSN